MLRRILFLLLLLTLPLLAHADSWSHYPYAETYSRVCSLGDRLYFIKSGMLFKADAEAWSVDGEMTRADGLSSTDIFDICYSQQAHCLVVVHNDWLIDIIESSGNVWTVTDLYNAPMAGTDKTISSIREQEGQLFICTAYGFAVIDLLTGTVLQNIDLGTTPYCAWAYDGKWYYSDKTGNYYCPQHGGNPYTHDGWTFNTGHSIEKAVVLQNAGVEQCWLLSRDNALRRIIPGTTQCERFTDYSLYTDLQRCGRFIMAVNADSLVFFDTSIGLPPGYGQSFAAGQRRVCTQVSPLRSATGICSLGRDGEELALLFPQAGIRAYSITLSGATSFSATALHSLPLTVSNSQQSGTINRIVVGPGHEVAFCHTDNAGASYLSYYRLNGYLTTYTSANSRWTNYSATVVSSALETRQRFVGVTQMIADPFHASRYYFGTIEDGIVAIDHGKFYCRYLHNNSGLEMHSNVVRMGGLTFDADGNLWCTNEGGGDIIRVRTPEDKWYKFNIRGFELAYGFTNQLVRKSGNAHHFWGYQQFTYQKSNVIVYDDNGTLDNAGDDRYVTFRDLQPIDGDAFTPDYGRGVYVGPDSAIWLLNDKGIYIIDDPDSVFAHPGRVRTVMTDVLPSSLAIDSRRHVWVSTEGDGLYLLSTDGREQYAHLSTGNSVLTSDEVHSIAFDSLTSTLWMAIDNELLAYQYDVSQYGSAEADGYQTAAYCYPAQVSCMLQQPHNATRSMVTVFGLTDDTVVTVTNSQDRPTTSGTALGGLFQIDTTAYPVGTYTVTGTDAAGHRGSLLTFDVIE